MRCGVKNFNKNGGFSGLLKAGEVVKTHNSGGGVIYRYESSGVLA